MRISGIRSILLCKYVLFQDVEDYWITKHFKGVTCNRFIKDPTDYKDSTLLVKFPHTFRIISRNLLLSDMNVEFRGDLITKLYLKRVPKGFVTILSTSYYISFREFWKINNFIIIHFTLYFT